MTVLHINVNSVSLMPTKSNPNTGHDTNRIASSFSTRKTMKVIAGLIHLFWRTRNIQSFENTADPWNVIDVSPFV